MKYQPGELVIHKLTEERMLVLSQDGYSITSIPKVRVRRKDFSDLFLDEDEVRAIKHCVNCGKSEFQIGSMSGCTGPCLFE